MKLFIKERDKQFEMVVLGYEYMKSEIVEDLNWLNVKIIVSDETNNWSSEGPYVRTFDLIEIYSWFSNIKQGKVVTNRLDFLEHELSFEFYEVKKTFSINLDYDIHPKGKNYDHGTDREYKIIFEISEINLEIILKQIKVLIHEFPIRNFQEDDSIN